MRTIIISEIKNYNFLQSNFSCLFVGKFFSDNVKIYAICQLLLYRHEYGKISQLQGTHTPEQFLISFSFQKLFPQVVIITPIVKKICSIIIFGTEFLTL